MPAFFSTEGRTGRATGAIVSNLVKGLTIVLGTIQPILTCDQTPTADVTLSLTTCGIAYEDYLGVALLHRPAEAVQQQDLRTFCEQDTTEGLCSVIWPG